MLHMKQWLNQHKFYNCPHPTFCCLLIHKSPLLPSHRVLLFGGHGKEQIPAASSLLIVSHVSGRAITLDGSTAQDWQAPGHTFSWDISRPSCVSQPRLSIRTPSTLSRGQNRVHFTESRSSLSWKAPSKGHEQGHLPLIPIQGPGHFQGRGIHHPSGQLVPVIDHPHCKNSALMSNLRISLLCCLWEEFIVEM